jgi:hypothetical protein
MKIAIPILCLALLAGCSDDPAVPTTEENRQLDDASAMLNEAPANLEAVDDGGLNAANSLANQAP